MNVTVVTKCGGPDVLKLNEAPVPGPGPGQVSIDVALAGVNSAEVTAHRGHLQVLRPPFVPGLEVLGRTVKRGELRVDITDVMPVARACGPRSLLGGRRSSMGKLLLEMA